MFGSKFKDPKIQILLFAYHINMTIFEINLKKAKEFGFYDP